MDQSRFANDPDAVLEAIDPAGAIVEDELDRLVERLVVSCDPGQLREVVRRRLNPLSGARGAVVLRLLERVPTPDLLADLAEALSAQSDLPPELAWEALNLLRDTAELKRRPELAEWLADLDEAFEEEDETIRALAEQIEQDPDGMELAIQGLSSLEPALRAEMIEHLAEVGGGPNLIEFVRILSHAHDEPTSHAARSALMRLGAGTELVRVDWSSPCRVGSLVTTLDGRGHGQIALAAEDRGGHVVAVFACDVLHGIRDVAGHTGLTASEAREFLAEIAARPEYDVIDHVDALAIGLLGSCLALCGPTTSPAVRYWLERTVGRELGTSALSTLFSDRGTDAADAEAGDLSVAEHSRAVLEASTRWLDDSELTYELAEELLLRGSGEVLNPRQESGLCRFLFERRLQHRVELDRRILAWMGAFWEASEAPDLARSARFLARQLSDAQNLVPGHPWFLTLSVRSLTAAQEHLRSGVDPRGSRPGPHRLSRS